MVSRELSRKPSTPFGRARRSRSGPSHATRRVPMRSRSAADSDAGEPSGRTIRSVCSTVVVTARSEEHTSELQSQSNLVCRLLLEKKKKNLKTIYNNKKKKKK